MTLVTSLDFLRNVFAQIEKNDKTAQKMFALKLFRVLGPKVLRQQTKIFGIFIHSNFPSFSSFSNVCIVYHASS